MSQPFSPDLPKTWTGQSPLAPQSRRDRAPGVQRIAGWSARHRKTAVLGWLALVAVIFLGGQGLGIKSLPPSPAQVVVSGGNLTGPAMRHAIAALNARASAASSIREPITATPVAGGRALLVDVPLAGTGSGSVANDALLSLRNQAGD